jgi:hypothetical protein
LEFHIFNLLQLASKEAEKAMKVKQGNARRKPAANPPQTRRKPAAPFFSSDRQLEITRSGVAEVASAVRSAVSGAASDTVGVVILRGPGIVARIVILPIRTGSLMAGFGADAGISGLAVGIASGAKLPIEGQSRHIATIDARPTD